VRRLFIAGVVFGSAIVASVIGVGVAALREMQVSPGVAVETGQSAMTLSLTYLDVSRKVVVMIDDVGRETSRRAAGGYVRAASLDHDGKRLAMWRSPSEAETGPYELAVWDLGSGSISVLGPMTTEIPIGAPIWSVSSDAIVGSLAQERPASERTPTAMPRTTRMVLFTLDGRSREFGQQSNTAPLQPLYADDAIITAISVDPASQRYVVFERQTGSIAHVARTPGYQNYGADARSGVIFGVRQETPNAPPEHLYAWRASNYSDGVLTFDSPTVNAPLFWPGRQEILFGTGGELVAVRTSTRVTRRLLTQDTLVMPRAVDPTGQRVLIGRLRAPLLVLHRASDGHLDPVGREVSIPPNVTILGWYVP
jgi:hypothetical protein